jgi:predicted SnoaL-like aldol condensation-catalyzing enzyme
VAAISPNMQAVTLLFKSIETGDPAPVDAINPNRYIQHNRSAADGLQGFDARLAQLPPHAARVNTDYDYFGPKIGYDIFRFENGQFVEHWDNLQQSAPTRNPSGHTMIDGPTEALDADQTDANKALVRRFVQDILVNGRMEQLAVYFDGDHYLKHNPQIDDGVAGLKQSVTVAGQPSLEVIEGPHGGNVFGGYTITYMIPHGATMLRLLQPGLPSGDSSATLTHMAQSLMLTSA